MIFGSQKGDSRVKFLLDELNIKYSITDNGRFRVLVTFEDGRSQLAFIDSTTYEFAGFEMREIWSIAHIFRGIPESSAMLRLLMHNEAVKIGSWRIIERDPQEFMVVFAAAIAADTDAYALQRVLRAVLQTADAMEQELNGKDEF
ncbi:MAG: hypothetical protein Q6J68_03985 [Thermostichales cyanobacterium SZTDM-1c_bins_54]